MIVLEILYFCIIFVVSLRQLMKAKLNRMRVLNAVYTVKSYLFFKLKKLLVIEY